MDPADRPNRRTSAARLSAPIILPFPSVDSQQSAEATQAPARSQTFLEELELRQDEVLQQLDDLDRRVLALLDEYVLAREAS